MKTALLFTICVGTIVVGACSSESDDVPALQRGNVDAPPRGEQTTSGDAAVSDDEKEAGTDDPGDASAVEVDATTPPSGGNCTAGFQYCGGNKVIGDSSTLYKCNGPGEPTVIAKCDRGCIVNPNSVDADDACVPERVQAPVPGRVVTYPWGTKDSAYRLGYHTGDDYATPQGSYALAVRSGTIRWSNDNGGDFGWWIGLDADNGRTYVYAHLSRRLAQVGDKVLAGQVIGLTGNTGFSTGPHLHFEDRPLGATTNDNTRKPTW